MTRALLAGLAVLVFAAAAGVAPGIGPALAQSGYDRPGGDYASAAVPNGDPAVCASRCEHEKNCRAWSFSYPTASGTPAMCFLKREVVPRTQSSCCVSGVRGAGVIEPQAGAIEYSIDRYGGDYKAFETPPDPKGKPAPMPAKPRSAAGPGPIAGRATARPPRTAISRRRSSRRATGRAAFRAWCGKRDRASTEPR